MKLYNIYNEIILEAVSNFKTWITGSNNITKTITDMLADDSGGKFYYCDIVYPNKKGIDQKRWVIITQYGISKKDNPIIRALEVNSGASDGNRKAKTYNINKIKRMSVSKVPIYNVPQEFVSLYGDIANDTTSNNPFKDGQPIITAKFGTYQYAASTLKNKERAAAKAAELEKQQTTQQPATEPVEPAQTTTQQKTVEPQVPQQQNKQVVTPQQEPEVETPEVNINPEDEENDNLLNNNKLKK